MKVKRKHVVLAGLVLALGTAVYVNWNLSQTPDLSSKKEFGKATYVNSNIIATSDEISHKNKDILSDEQKNYFANARLNRDKIYDETRAVAMEALSMTDSDEDIKESALNQLSKLEETLLNQNSVENILMAKGFTDCVCTLSDTAATVIVPEINMNDSSLLIIKDAVSNVCTIPFENISVVTV